MQDAGTVCKMILFRKKEKTIRRLGKLLLYASMVLMLIILPGCNNEKVDSSVQNERMNSFHQYKE